MAWGALGHAAAFYLLATQSLQVRGGEAPQRQPGMPWVGLTLLYWS